MNRMSLEQANEHYRLQREYEIATMRFEAATGAIELSEEMLIRAKTALFNFESLLEEMGIDIDSES